MPRFGPKNAKEEEIFAIENFRADLQQVVYSTMERNKVTRKELARKLGCSAAYVTQLLSEDWNPTIETVARIFHALGDEGRISSKAFDEARSEETTQSYIDTLAKVLAERWAALPQGYITWSVEGSPAEVDAAPVANTNYRRRRGHSAEHVMRTLWESYVDPRKRSMAISNRNHTTYEVSEDAAKAA